MSEMTRYRWLIRYGLLCVAISVAGCSDDINSDYGVRTGYEKTSVNGTTVFSEMFETAGYSVSSRDYISPRLDDFDVVVWTPDDFSPPSIAQRIGMESWLDKGNRTLIYIGRDFDALPKYWDQVFEDAPPDQQLELWRQREFARSSFASRRNGIPDDAMVRWFKLRNRGEKEVVSGIRSSDPTWLEDIDTAKLDIVVQAYCEIPEERDRKKAAKATATLDATDFEMNFDNSFDEFETRDAKRQATLPPSFKVLLETDSGIPLITEIRDPTWGDSKIIVIPNGSFLLNLPLVNNENRKLAQRLIAECGGERAGFLLTTTSGRGAHSSAESGTLPGIAAFTSWPLGIIIFHAFLAGVLLLFSAFPILGRPRDLEKESTADFGNHVRAIGSLLGRVCDRQHAMQAIAKYQGQHGENAGKPTNEPTNLL
jgi:hypothetical protein